MSRGWSWLISVAAPRRVGHLVTQETPVELFLRALSRPPEPSGPLLPVVHAVPGHPQSLLWYRHVCLPIFYWYLKLLDHYTGTLKMDGQIREGSLEQVAVRKVT